MRGERGADPCVCVLVHSILAEDAVQAAAADVIKKNPQFRQFVPESHLHTLDRKATVIPPAASKTGSSSSSGAAKSEAPATAAQ